jgi:HAD superfamily hydrolase (TIGR01490 family)
MKKVVAVFDFDGTLTKRDSLPRFLWHYAGPRQFIRKSLSLAPALLKYLLGRLDNHAAKEKVFITFFARARKNEFSAKAGAFSRMVLPSLVKAECAKKLQWHQQQGHQCLLVSASIEDYLIPWAERAGFAKVLGTRLEIDATGFLTGRLLGGNCYGAEKVRRMQEYLGSLRQFEIYAYGDSRGDKELLETADHPFYRTVKDENAFPC